MLNFLRAAYKDMSTLCLSQLTLQIFYQCVFSYKMFNYKASHGGLLMRFNDYVRYVEPDRAQN